MQYIYEYTSMLYVLNGKRKTKNIKDFQALRYIKCGDFVYDKLGMIFSQEQDTEFKFCNNRMV